MIEESSWTSCAVIGFGVAAVGAALELASQGRSSIVISYPTDSICLRGSVVILPNPLSGRRTPGFEFEEIALNALGSAGVSVDESVFVTLAWPDGFELRFEGFSSHTRIIKTDRIIFAPAGTEPTYSTRPDLRGFYGHGIFSDAWSDAPCHKGKPVTVVGCGSRAVEQCYIASQYASNTTLFCEEPRLTPSAQRWREMFPEAPRVDCQFGVRFVSALPDDLGRLRQIVVSDDTGERTLDVSALFFARELTPDWSIFGNQSQANDLMARRALIPAGLAAGIPYDDHESLFNDGVRAARERL